MTVRRILAIKLRNIGDTALLTAPLAALRRHYPEAEIDVLVPRHCGPVLEFFPGLRKVWILEKDESLPPKLLALRSQKYDLALGFHATAQLCRWMGLLGARERVLHHHSRTKTPFWSTRPIARPGNLEDALKRDYQLLDALGVPTNDVEPRLHVPAPLRLAARSKALRETDREARWVALMPGAREATRRYPKDLWLAVLDDLRARAGTRVAVFADEALSREWDLPSICGERGVTLFDRLSLRELIVELSHYDALVGNDSGPFHLAAALGLKTVAIFGAGCAGDFHPYDPKSHAMLRHVVPCRASGPKDRELFRYCTVASCEHLSCLRGIAPERVVKALDALT